MSRNAMLIGILVLALIACLIMWMRYSDSRDARLEVDIGWVGGDDVGGSGRAAFREGPTSVAFTDPPSPGSWEFRRPTG